MDPALDSASRPRTRSPRASARLAALLALTPIFGCASSEPGPSEPGPSEPPTGRRMTLESFRELLEAGEVRSTEAAPADGGSADPNPAGGGGASPGPLASSPQDAAPVPERPVPTGAEDPPEVPQETGPPFNPWREFGPRILWDADARLITKPYPIRVGMGENVHSLAVDYGGFRLHDPAAGPQGQDSVLFDFQKEFDAELLSPDLRAPPGSPWAKVPLADWLFVTASPEVLREFEYFLDTFFASPPQIEIEAKIVEVVLRDDFDMGVSDFLAELPDNVFVDTLGFSFPNTAGTAEFFTQIGAIQDGTTYSALIEALATLENVSITSRPRSVVREGARARIESIDRIPFLQLTTVNASGGFNTQLQWQEVGVRLYATPRLLGSDTVSLEIDIEASQQTGNAVTVQTAGGEDVTTPILSTRLARTQVYLRDGQAVILGGLIAERAVDDIRKLPLFGDLPVVGSLFRSTFQSTEKTQILFFIRPRVIEGSDLSREF